MSVAPRIPAPRKGVFVLVIPGIESSDGSDQFAWPRRLVTWLEVNTPAKAEAYQYHVSFFDRFLFQSTHVKRVVEKIEERSQENVVLVGHSNGCDIIGRVLKTGIPIQQVHLFAAATDEGNISDALGRNLSQAFAYGSNDDLVLKDLAPLSRLAFGWAGLGYGDLGRVGPTDPRITKDWRPGYGHGTWFDNQHLSDTAKTIATSLDPFFK